MHKHKRKVTYIFEGENHNAGAQPDQEEAKLIKPALKNSKEDIAIQGVSGASPDVHNFSDKMPCKFIIHKK